jgi:hypothetical protein
MLQHISPRQREILALISRYGVLGSNTLHVLLKEVVDRECLRKTLKRMEEQNLISRIFLGSGGAPMAHWMIPDDDTMKGQALRATGLDPKHFRLKRVRYSHAPHEGVCTLVQASLERQMPRLWIYRESTADFRNLPPHLISEHSEESGNIPDLCVGVPGRNADPLISDKGYRWIGVEVDRTSRSKKRIAHRVNLYTKRTGFSGLLYLVPTLAAVKSVREIYLTRGDKSAYRLRGAAQSFLAVGVFPKSLFDVNAMRVWVGEHEIPLSTWLSLFALHDAHERDRELSGMAAGTGRGA